MVAADAGLTDGDELIDAQAISLVTGSGTRAKAWSVPKGADVVGLVEQRRIPDIRARIAEDYLAAFAMAPAFYEVRENVEAGVLG